MELDLAQLIAWGKGIFAAILALIAAFTAGPSVVSAMKSKLATTSTKDLSPEKDVVETKSNGADSNSDKLPPVGFEIHVATIVGAAPFATSDVLLEYLKKGMTEAQVLRAEVTRMGSMGSNAAPSKEIKS